jgi:hypothetical protein
MAHYDQTTGVRLTASQNEQIEAIRVDHPELSKTDILRLGVGLAIAHLRQCHATVAQVCNVCGTKLTISVTTDGQSKTVPA